MLSKDTLKIQHFPTVDNLILRLKDAGGFHEEYGHYFDCTVSTSVGKFPIHLTASASDLSHPYFRVGKYLILDPALNCAKDAGNEDEAIIKECQNTSSVIFLADYKGNELQYSERATNEGYYLPNTVGCMIALQVMGDMLNEKVVLDVGSRNTLLSQVSLREGAHKAIAVEPNPGKVFFSRKSLFDYLGDEIVDFEYIDRMLLNSALNRSTDQIDISRSTLEDTPCSDEVDVAILNFPNFGLDPFDKSLLNLTVERFQKISLAVVSGGARIPDRNDLMYDYSQEFIEDAEKLGWNVLEEITVTTPRRGSVSAYEVIDTFTEYPTYILERP